jgi:hypothetical protein
MSSESEFFQMMKLNSHSGTVQMLATYGELSVYDPATHSAKFLLPLHRDNSNNPIETGFLQVGTFFNGPGYGAQFPPPVAAQAVILFIDAKKIVPVAAVFLMNDVETPPFTDGKSAGWQDAKGSKIRTTVDGATPGDGAGGARVSGSEYASVTAGTLTELGAEGLDPTQDAVVTQRYLNAALVAERTVTQAALTALANMVQGGTGVSPPMIAPITVSGSAAVRAKQ